MRTPTTLALTLGAGLLGGGVVALVDDPGTRVVTSTRPPAAPVSAPAPQNAAAPLTSGLSAGEIYRRDAPGVVVITATTTAASPFDGLGAPQQAQSLGSGFVIDREGRILTNAHVVVDATEVEVGFEGGNTYPAKMLGIDESTDLAVLDVEVDREALTPLPLGTTSGVRVGDPVAAIGNPLGTERTLTTGVISAVSRSIESLVQGVQIYGALQTDASINHGNSGGPLIDRFGRVVGINSQILSENNGSVGIGFAIPIDTARRVADQIIETGEARHAALGIEGSEITDDLADTLDLPVDRGVLVGSVVDGSAADTAGIQGSDDQRTINGVSYPVGGDIITAIDGRRIETFADLALTVGNHAPGDQLTLTVLRDGESRDVRVTLQAREE